MGEYPKFSDFAEEQEVFDGDKKRIDDVLNKDILIINFKVKDSKKRENSLYATIHIKIDGSNYIIFSGSIVLIDQLEKYKNNLPFYTAIKKIDRYYTFT